LKCTLLSSNKRRIKGRDPKLHFLAISVPEKSARRVTRANPCQILAAKNELHVTVDDYPALFQAADRASLFIQKRHLYLTGSVLTLLVGGAAAGAVSGAFPSARAKTALAFASTACVALSFVLTAIRQALKPEKLWYGGRAVAESVKSMTWRYMTGAEPVFHCCAGRRDRQPVRFRPKGADQG
jgi:hypothetical protein